MATRGEKRHLVTLQNPTGPPVPDGDGNYTQMYETFSTRYAAIQAATARDLERVTAGTVLSTATQIVTMDFHPDVTTETRLSWTDPAGRAHAANVTGVNNPQERCIELVLVCVEVVP